MNFAQVKFSTEYWERGIEHGGFAIYDDDYVFCGIVDCADGSFYPPDVVSIIRIYNNWIDLSKDTIGIENEEED